MIDEFITKAGDAIRDTLGGWFTLSWIPEQYWWIFYLILFGMFCGIVIWFFGWSKIVRMVASLAFLAAAIFTAGGWFMSKRISDKARDASEVRKRQQAAQRMQRQQAQQQQPWKWPWDN